MRNDGSSLFVMAVLALTLMIGVAWAWSRYQHAPAPPAHKVGCGMTPLP